MKSFNFNNKVAIITGGSSGIGKALATELIKKYNCRVFAIARNEERLRLVKEELGEKYVPTPFDVCLEENWQAFAQKLKNDGVRVDILINCAGILPKFIPFEKSNPQSLKSVFDINFFSCVYSCHHTRELMENGGMIVNISSASALCPFSGVSAYSSSKSALDRFSTALAYEYKEISVTTALPGFVKTDIMKNQNASNKDKSLIDKFSANPNKIAKKILKKAGKRKKRVILGFDGKLLDFMYKHFPSLAPSLIGKFLKKSGLELFSEL
ncbi:MAG: SDR family oxidoreductase [Clostridia bacterium]|nr:SDR family oxidoreductase [Clostridia bacterium]